MNENDSGQAGVTQISDYEFDRAVNQVRPDWPFLKLEVGQSIRVNASPEMAKRMGKAIRNHSYYHRKRFQTCKIQGAMLIKRLK